MKKLFLVFSIVSVLTSCNAFKEQIDNQQYITVYEYGNPVKISVNNNVDSTTELEDIEIVRDIYPINDLDSTFIGYHPETNEQIIYLVESTRYVVLNQFHEVLWFESK